jgi:hypothetical protein
VSEADYLDARADLLGYKAQSKRTVSPFTYDMCSVYPENCQEEGWRAEEEIENQRFLRMEARSHTHTHTHTPRDTHTHTHTHTHTLIG